MPNSCKHLLLVESDPATCDLISRQTLEPLGYRVSVVQAVPLAIQEAPRLAPDLIIVSLKMPGLSGKDLLVALSAQGCETPAIVLAEKGMEADVVQAFRLGAVDYLSFPVRETELVSAVERALKPARQRQEHERLARQLQETSGELQRRVRELTTIFAIGKAFTSIRDQCALFEKLVEAAIYISEASCGWFLLRKEAGKPFLLSAYRNLPPDAAAKANQPWEDGISSLVAQSGEPLAIHGKPLKRLPISAYGQAALVVPVKVKVEVVGLLVVVRKADRPFNPGEQALLEAVADFAAISLVNARQYQAFKERANSLQKAIENTGGEDHRFAEILEKFDEEARTPLMVAMGYLEMLMAGEFGSLTDEQMSALRVVNAKLDALVNLVETKVLRKAV